MSKRQGVDLAKSIGVSIGRIDMHLDKLEGDEIFFRGLSIKSPSESQGDFFVVARWYVGGDAKVSFHSAATLWECLKGFCDRVANRTMTFKDDQYA